MEKEKEIRRILVDEIGWIEDHIDNLTGKKWYEADTKIHRFYVNGEMALVSWFRQGEREFNGKFVKCIEYRNDELKK